MYLLSHLFIAKTVSFELDSFISLPGIGIHRICGFEFRAAQDKKKTGYRRGQVPMCDSVACSRQKSML